MNPIRVAFVGCGRISDLHQMGYRGRDDAKIVAVCDVNKAEAKKKAKEWGVDKVYSDYQQVLEDKEIDAVELITPHHLHCPMTIQAAEAGKHISVQKPMALCADEECFRHPELLGLEGENLLAQQWLMPFTSAEAARAALRDAASVQEVWVVSCTDVAPINLAAALKRDRVDRRVCMLTAQESGSLRSSASDTPSSNGGGAK